MMALLIVQATGRIEKFREQNQKFYWKDLALATQVPMPRSNKGIVVTDSDESLYVRVYKTKESEFKDYIKRCEQEGYVQESDRGTAWYKAYNKEGYCLGLSYYASEKKMTIDLDAPMKMQLLRWPNIGMAALLPKPKQNKGKIQVDTSDEFIVYVGETTQEEYADYAVQCASAGFDQNYDKEDTYYDAYNAQGDYLHMAYKGGQVMYIDLIKGAEKTAESEEGMANQEEKKTESGIFESQLLEPEEDEAAVPDAASLYRYENYEDVQNKLQKAGFENISYEILYDIFWGWTDEGEVEQVSIDGKTDFESGDIFKRNAPVVITYHMKEEDDPNKPVQAEPTATPKPTPEAVSYSTNRMDTVKNGNSGVYAYKRSAKFYDLYYIIDFDEGNVYYFTEGNGDSGCDKIKIDSGTLNDVVIIIYHDGDTTWQEGLHFKWVKQPDHLILVDHNYQEYDYYTTSLAEALRLRDKKTIHEY